MKGTTKKEHAQTRKIDIAADGIPSPAWKGRLTRFCVRAMLEAGVAEWELSLLLCGDERMTNLNLRYRRKSGPTDVLSFPRAAATGARRRPLPGLAGDIAISMDTLRRNARAFDVTEDEELKRLLVHGILHLAGMDHGSGKGREMLSLQERLLERLKEERIIEK